MNYRNLKVCLAALAAVLLAPAPALGQDDEPIIIDDLSPAQLRAEIEKIENEFYRVFNASVDDEKLKVECLEYTPTGSHIRQRACEPKFFTDARNDNVRNWQDSVDELSSLTELRASLQPEFEALTAAMNALLGRSDYFRELNGILRMLRERRQELEAQ